MIDWLLLVLPGLIWGASFLFIAEGLDAMAPNGVTFTRVAIGFLTLALVPAARRPILRSDRWATAALGVLWLAFPLSMFPFAEQHVSSALTGMLNGATPIFAAVVATLIARRLPPRAVLVGVGVGFAGAVITAMPGFAGGSGSPDQAIGIGLIVAALASYGVAINLARPLQQRNGALPVIWRSLGVAVLLTAPLGAPALARAHWSWRSLTAMLMLGAFGTAIAHVLAATAAGRLGATRAAATTFVMPVVALILGITIRGERVEAMSVAGAAVCLGGAWIIRHAGIRKSRDHEVQGAQTVQGVQGVRDVQVVPEVREVKMPSVRRPQGV
ncbi:MAG TPA: DMT family transporter [Vicinamibacterales bacterium]|jgi:drug/metabolite transporter (DMT)-like permease